MLIAAKADVDKTAYGWQDETPLTRAVEEGEWQCARLLVDAGASDPEGAFASMSGYVPLGGSSTWQCRTCGNSNPEEHAFCTECFCDKPLET